VNTLKVKLVELCSVVLKDIELDLHIMVVNIVLKFQSPLQVIMVFMLIGNSKWSREKVKIG
jgi:hypothetical protein